MMQHNDTTTSKKGQHLTLSERIEIQVMKQLEYSNRSIARILNRSHSTINDEIKRGTTDQVKLVNGRKIFSRMYFAETGQAIYVKHREACKPVYKVVQAEEFLRYADQKLKVDQWSPDAIVGHAAKNQLFSKIEMVCTKTLYNYIDSDKMNTKNIDLLLKTRRSTKTPANRERKRILGKSIDERPEYINDRQEFGHWEIDTVIGKKTKNEAVLLTLTERLSRLELIIKITGKNETAVKQAMESMTTANPHFKEMFKSFTADNGSEFASLEDAVKEISEVYFSHPYSSWERGTNENHNGIIRRFIPKGKSLNDITESSIKRIMSWMNNLPRKKLNYQTPFEVFSFHIQQLQIA